MSAKKQKKLTARTVGGGLSEAIKKAQSQIRYGVFCGSGQMRIRSAVVSGTFFTREAAQTEADAARSQRSNWSIAEYTVLSLRKSEL